MKTGDYLIFFKFGGLGTLSTQDVHRFVQLMG